MPHVNNLSFESKSLPKLELAFPLRGNSQAGSKDRETKINPPGTPPRPLVSTPENALANGIIGRPHKVMSDWYNMKDSVYNSVSFSVATLLF